MSHDAHGPDPEVLEALQLGPAHKRRWVRWVIGVGAVAAVAVLLASLWPRGGSADGWELAAVERGSLDVTVSAVGTVRALHEVEVSSELSGIVVDVLVEANDVVRAGDALAVLDTRQLEAQVVQADAEVARAVAGLRQARIEEERARLERDRTRTVAAGGGTSQAERDRTRLTHESAVAAVQIAQAQLESTRAAQQVTYTSLDKAVIRSPTDGVVLVRDVDPGQAVVSAMAAPVLFRVAEDLQRMSLVVDIDEADVGRVHAGQQATFTVAAWPEHTFEARVHIVRLAPTPGSEVVTYEAELDVENREQMLRPGMTATASLVSEQLSDVLLVPSAALRFQPGKQEPPPGPHVWVVEDGALRPIPVDIGASDGARTSVDAEEELVGREVATGLRAELGT